MQSLNTVLSLFKQNIHKSVKTKKFLSSLEIDLLPVCQEALVV